MPLISRPARGRCWFMDSKGLIVRGRKRLKPHTLPYAHPHAEIGDLATAIEALRRSQHARGSDLTAEEQETLEVVDLLPPEEGP